MRAWSPATGGPCWWSSTWTRTSAGTSALGLSIDYSLLIVSRFREERAAGFGVPVAVERTAATAGRTIAFSALTVAVCLSALFTFDGPIFRAIGAGGVAVVLVALLAALTLVPALLAVTGHRMRIGRDGRTMLVGGSEPADGARTGESHAPELTPAAPGRARA